MSRRLAALLLSSSALACVPVDAHPSRATLVDVSIAVDGRRSPLYPARDGSGRLYLEARPGSDYTLTLENRTAERLGVVVLVDGLNVISANREEPLSGSPGRMYVLDPWGSTTIHGWRSSLEDVHTFRFEDESASYAARLGKLNRKMGWVEVAVHRDRTPRPDPGPKLSQNKREDKDGEYDERARRETPAAPSAEAQGGARDQSYPGTGWGDHRTDMAHLVHFDPVPHPAQVTTIRYEYGPALRALGILPSPPHRDRLRERDGGFAPVPPGY
jgi:hypothetical protein